MNLSEHCAAAYPDEAQPVRFLSIMRLMKDKGIEELLEAAGRVHEKHPEVEFGLLGAYEEESRARYEPQVAALEKAGALRYYGYRDDVPRFLAECQAVVHPSYHEGMSNVLLEAAATARTGAGQRCGRLPGYLSRRGERHLLSCAERRRACGSVGNVSWPCPMKSRPPYGRAGQGICGAAL